MGEPPAESHGSDVACVFQSSHHLMETNWCESLLWNKMCAWFSTKCVITGRFHMQSRSDIDSVYGFDNVTN